MVTLRKVVQLYLCLVLAMVLGMAGVARASHESHAPAQTFFADGGLSLSGKNCLTPHVDENGAPVAPVHIHACANCLMALDVVATTEPPTTIISKLDAPKKLTFDLQPVLHIVSVERVSSHGPRAPPSFS